MNEEQHKQDAIERARAELDRLIEEARDDVQRGTADLVPHEDVMRRIKELLKKGKGNAKG